MRHAVSLGLEPAGGVAIPCSTPARRQNPPGVEASAHVHSGAYCGVTISDRLIDPRGDEADPPELVSGSLGTVPADSPHVTACTSEHDCRFFLPAAGGFDFVPQCE